MQLWQIAAIVFSILIGISGIIGIFFANAKNKLAKTTTENYDNTIKSYKDIVESQEAKINILTQEMRELRSLHTENVKMIGQLQGELQTWKQLPIRELADNMAFVTEVQYIMAKHMGIDHLPVLKTKNKRKG